MKTIKIERQPRTKAQNVWTEDLAQWAANRLDRSDRDGQIENLEGQVQNLARAVGALLERLVQSGQMTTAEFLQIVAPYEHPEPKFVEVENP